MVLYTQKTISSARIFTVPRHIYSSPAYLQFPGFSRVLWHVQAEASLSFAGLAIFQALFKPVSGPGWQPLNVIDTDHTLRFSAHYVWHLQS
jgi:hypothetical protein